MRDSLVDKLKRVDPAWFGAAAAVAGAGAVLVPSHRLLVGAAGGGLVLWLALSRLPCCQACADGATAPATTQKPAGQGVAVGETFIGGERNVYDVPSPIPVEVQQEVKLATKPNAYAYADSLLATNNVDTTERRGVVDYMNAKAMT